jgi:hypothetical protein
MDNKITSEDVRWLRQLLGPVRKKPPEAVQRRLIALELVNQNVDGLSITDKGRGAIRRAA